MATPCKLLFLWVLTPSAQQPKPQPASVSLHSCLDLPEGCTALCIPPSSLYSHPSMSTYRWVPLPLGIGLATFPPHTVGQKHTQHSQGVQVPSSRVSLLPTPILGSLRLPTFSTIPQIFFLIFLPPLTGKSPSGVLGPSQLYRNPQVDWFVYCFPTVPAVDT